MSELHNKRHEHFVEKLSLADFHGSPERAADVLGAVRVAAGRAHRSYSEIAILCAAMSAATFSGESAPSPPETGSGQAFVAYLRSPPAIAMIKVKGVNPGWDREK